MTALDEHRHRNADATELARIKGLVAEHGVKFIYYQFVSVNGRVLAKVVPAHQLERNLERGVQFHGSAIADLTTDRNGGLIGAGAQAAEFTALPDTSTFCVLPWDREFARFFCFLYVREDDAERPGEPLPTDCRGVLTRRHEEFMARFGLELRSGCEPEMSWLGPSIDPRPRQAMSPAYHQGTLDMMRPIAKKVITYALAMGLDMVEGDYEDNYQLELNWMFDAAHRTADRVLTYRQICRQVAKEEGVIASFMAKPYTGVMGNGCHHNLSLWTLPAGGAPVNVCADPAITQLHVTDRARHMIGGILHHAAGSMAVMASTVNSYKRFWDAGLFAPNKVNWGLDNKTCTLRVSANGRLEFKVPDASVNPYLSHAVLLATVADGLEHEIDPGPPTAANSYDATADFPDLPLTLGDALDEMAHDKVVRGGLTPELTDLFLEYKADEWARACGAVTDWDRDMYLEFLP
jgi:glutamine synthetase